MGFYLHLSLSLSPPALQVGIQPPLCPVLCQGGPARKDHVIPYGFLDLLWQFMVFLAEDDGPAVGTCPEIAQAEKKGTRMRPRRSLVLFQLGVYHLSLFWTKRRRCSCSSQTRLSSSSQNKRGSTEHPFMRSRNAAFFEMSLKTFLRDAKVDRGHPRMSMSAANLFPRLRAKPDRGRRAARVCFDLSILVL